MLTGHEVELAVMVEVGVNVETPTAALERAGAERPDQSGVRPRAGIDALERAGDVEES